MGKCNAAMCRYLTDRDRFAELINVSEFQGRPVLRGDMLEPDDVRYGELRPNQQQNSRKPQMEEHFRDIKMRTKTGEWIAVTAIENQENIDYTMPLRIMEYDCLEYNNQIRQIRAEKAKRLQEEGVTPCDWNTRLEENDRIVPVHTVCFYHGTQKWDGPRSLKDMMNFENASPDWESLFHDYGMSLFCANEVTDLSMFKTGLRQLFEVIPLRNDKEKLFELWHQEEFQHLDRDTAETIAILIDSTEVLERLDEYEVKGEYNMCQAVEEWKKDWLAEGTAQGIEQGVLDSICNLMKTLQFTAEQAMDALLVAEEDRGKYLAKM